MKLRKLVYAITILVVLFPIIHSILMDLATYNIIFPTDDDLFTYILKGIAFNWKKCIPPTIILLGEIVYEKSKTYSSRWEISKSRFNENKHIS